MENLIRKIIRNLFNESINIPIEIGDEILGGKFKNKKVKVKEIGKNEKGDITINGKPLLRFRLKNINESTSETYNVYYTKRFPNGDIDERILLNKTPFKHIKGATHFAKYKAAEFKIPVDKKDNQGFSMYRFTDVISIFTN